MRSAKLSIHPFSIGAYPEIREFIEKYSNRYSNLSINVSLILLFDVRSALMYLLHVFRLCMKTKRLI